VYDLLLLLLRLLSVMIAAIRNETRI
jgi:hypothetical protein